MHFRRVALAAAMTISLAGALVDDQATTPEAVFRKTLAEYRSAPQTRNELKRWTMWSQLAATLIESQDYQPLEIIQALEESILVIEQAVFQAGEADDLPRDKALAHLYYAYGKMLQSLSAQDCISLALDERTLLIGAETADAAKPSQQLCRENAENALRNAATLDATHDEAANLLADLLQQDSAEGVHKRKPKEFVAELFDSFADTFDSKLGALGYRVPGLVGEAAASISPSGYSSALDAGCGTGLAGRYLRPLVSGPLIGVDASQKMLDIANKCTTTSGCGIEENQAKSTASAPLYDGLFAMDLEDMTVSNTLQAPGVTRIEPKAAATAFDLVVAADVLVYFGQLDTILQTFASVSSPGAHLIFSCERTSEKDAPLGFRLLSSGRFAHTKAHAMEAAEKTGYDLVKVEEIVPRMEKGEEVQGYLFTFILREQQGDEL
jgi:predicted TPR repeat methyltransferase